MIEKKYSDLEQFQKMSEEMLFLAKTGEWEKLPDLESERKKSIESFFSDTILEQDSPQIEKVLQAVLLINDKIVKLAEQSKVSISLQRQDIKKRQNVHSAYLENK